MQSPFSKMEKLPNAIRLQQPLSKMFEKATSLLGISSTPKAPALDGEIVYCKNNVCVHQADSDDPAPGYLSLRCSNSKTAENQTESTLILHWVPNATICRNPKSIDSPVSGSPRNSSLIDSGTPSDSPPTQDLHMSELVLGKSGEQSVTNPPDTSQTDINRLSTDKDLPHKDYDASKPNTADNDVECLKNTKDIYSSTEQRVDSQLSTCTSGICSDDSIDKRLTAADTDIRSSEPRATVSSTSSTSVEDNTTSSSECLDDFVVVSPDDFAESTSKTDPFLSMAEPVLGYPEPKSKSSTLDSRCSAMRPLTLSLSSSTHRTKNDSDEEDTASISSGSTGGPDSDGSFSPTSASEISSMCDVISLTETAESIAETHNLMFPEVSRLKQEAGHGSRSSSPTPTRPSVFSVNLGGMRSLRLFFSEDSASCGQLVIASRESQYKIFHFYNGGLDKLAEILEEWNLFHSAKTKRWRRNGGNSPFTQQFRVVKPKISVEDERHPEESLFQKLNPESWRAFMNEQGQICDEISLKKTVFFGGIEPVLRKEVWPFLLSYFPYDSTFEQRELIRHDKYLQYQKIRKRRDKLSRNEQWNSHFWRSVQNIVEKDVIRTDRTHVYYKGEGNANVDVLKEILLNYAVQHPHLGYTQGMSDLLSPLLVEMTNESDAYWCFEGLMQRTIFCSQPKDQDMDKQLTYLKELLRLMFPKFYSHLQEVGEALGLLFVHRWILLCFKREFSEQDSLAIWETCWSNVQTDYFHLFVALSVITSYSDDIIQQNLPADEMLLHFSNLAHHMNGKLILIKARGLMHQFRLLEKIPCTVQDLCCMTSSGMWDSGHVPAIECVGHEGVQGCPYLGVSPKPLSISDHMMRLD